MTNNGGLIGLLTPAFLFVFLPIYFIVKTIAFRNKCKNSILFLMAKVEDLTKEVEDLKKRLDRAASQSTRASVSADSSCEEKPAPDIIYFPDAVGSAKIAYHYTDVPFRLLPNSYPSAFMKKPISFRMDGSVINVYCSSLHVGSLPPGKITDMISDWLRRGDPYRAVVTNTDDRQQYCSFDVAFYRERDSCRFYTTDDDDDDFDPEDLTELFK